MPIYPQILQLIPKNVREWLLCPGLQRKRQSLGKDSESLREKITGMEGIPCTSFSANFTGKPFLNCLDLFISKTDF